MSISTNLTSTDKEHDPSLLLKYVVNVIQCQSLGLGDVMMARVMEKEGRIRPPPG